MRNGNHVWKGLAAGAVGGLAGSWTMNQFIALVSKLRKRQQEEQQEHQAQHEGEQAASQGMDKPATLLLAEKLSQKLLHHELSESEQKIAEPIVHYGYGTFVGGLYGAAVEIEPKTATAFGLPYAAALWLAGDEVAVPALGLAKPPTQYPVSSHLQALGAHLVYGLTTDVVRRALRRAFA